jgi:hypothetical protein
MPTTGYMIIRPSKAHRADHMQTMAKVAARELLTLAFYGMRDGDVRRALQRGQAA